MKTLSFFLLILSTMTMCSKVPNGQKILISTSEGDIKLVLYDETPLHRDNFMKLAKDGYYKNLSFHRVIEGFMIQAGDNKAPSDSTESKFEDKKLLPPEFHNPMLFHKAGALAAARWGDEENPKKMSDAFQFYIVSGKPIFDEKIVTLEKERFEKLKQSILKGYQAATMDTLKALYKEGNRAAIAELRANNVEKSEKEAEERRSEILYTDEQKSVYQTIGGAPHLDGEYTVFGEVYEGLDVVKKIEKVETNSKDRPLQPIIIKQVELID